MIRLPKFLFSITILPSFWPKFSFFLPQIHQAYSRWRPCFEWKPSNAWLKTVTIWQTMLRCSNPMPASLQQLDPFQYLCPLHLGNKPQLWHSYVWDIKPFSVVENASVQLFFQMSFRCSQSRYFFKDPPGGGPAVGWKKVLAGGVPTQLPGWTRLPPENRGGGQIQLGCICSAIFWDENPKRTETGHFWAFLTLFLAPLQKNLGTPHRNFFGPTWLSQVEKISLPLDPPGFGPKKGQSPGGYILELWICLDQLPDYKQCQQQSPRIDRLHLWNCPQIFLAIWIGNFEFETYGLFLLRLFWSVFCIQNGTKNDPKKAMNSETFWIARLRKASPLFFWAHS